MDRKALKQILDVNKFEGYSLHGPSIDSGLVMEPAPLGRFRVYGVDRGEASTSVKTFDTEQAACEYFLLQVKQYVSLIK